MRRFSAADLRCPRCSQRRQPQAAPIRARPSYEPPFASSGVPAGLTGALVLDLDDGSARLRANADKSLAPASTEKLTVALAALQELGAGFRIETIVLGQRFPRRNRSGAAPRAQGASATRASHADDLALPRAAVRALGIRAVSGRVLGDESFFDRRRTAPGWKPSYYKIESAPLSALIVDRAWLNGRTRTSRRWPPRPASRERSRRPASPSTASPAVRPRGPAAVRARAASPRPAWPASSTT